MQDFALLELPIILAIIEPTMISFSNLTKTYKKRNVVDDFSLSVDVPIFGFLGQNGAGKTTIMKMIVGLLAPTSGTITIDGLLSSSLDAKKKIGYMPETPYFYERMTGMEFLRFCDELYDNRQSAGPHTGKNRTDHYEKLLKKVGIFAARGAQIYTYSKGMR